MSIYLNTCICRQCAYFPFKTYFYCENKFHDDLSELGNVVVVPRFSFSQLVLYFYQYISRWGHKREREREIGTQMNDTNKIANQQNNQIRTGDTCNISFYFFYLIFSQTYSTHTHVCINSFALCSFYGSSSSLIYATILFLIAMWDNTLMLDWVAFIMLFPSKKNA